MLHPLPPAPPTHQADAVGNNDARTDGNGHGESILLVQRLIDWC